MKWGHPLYYSLRSLGVRNNLGISMLINLIFLPIPINLILFSHPKSSTTVSSDVIPRKFCFSLKASQEIGRPSGHSNRGQRRHVHIWRHVVVRKGKRETVKKRERERKGESTTLSDGINWRLSPSKRLPGVHCDVLHRTDEERWYLPTYLSLACTSGAATRAEDTAGIRRPDQMHPVFHHSSVYVRATTVSFHPGFCHVFRFRSLGFFFCFSDFLSRNCLFDGFQPLFLLPSISSFWFLILLLTVKLTSGINLFHRPML